MAAPLLWLNTGVRFGELVDQEDASRTPPAAGAPPRAGAGATRARAGGRELLLWRHGATVAASDAACPHQGADLSGGAVSYAPVALALGAVAEALAGTAAAGSGAGAGVGAGAGAGARRDSFAERAGGLHLSDARPPLPRRTSAPPAPPPPPAGGGGGGAVGRAPSAAHLCLTCPRHGLSFSLGTGAGAHHSFTLGVYPTRLGDGSAAGAPAVLLRSKARAVSIDGAGGGGGGGGPPAPMRAPSGAGADDAAGGAPHSPPASSASSSAFDSLSPSSTPRHFNLRAPAGAVDAAAGGAAAGRPGGAVERAGVADAIRAATGVASEFVDAGAGDAVTGATATVAGAAATVAGAGSPRYGDAAIVASAARALDASVAVVIAAVSSGAATPAAAPSSPRRTRAAAGDGDGVAGDGAGGGGGGVRRASGVAVAGAGGLATGGGWTRGAALAAGELDAADAGAGDFVEGIAGVVGVFAEPSADAFVYVGLSSALPAHAFSGELDF